jgi:DNA-directed RNA polymerase specialized sigma24 family protein
MAGRAHVTFEELLTHPEVIAIIVYILRRARTATQDLNDGVGYVQEKMLRSQRNKPHFLWPNTLPAMKALARKTTTTYLIDLWRKKELERKGGNVGLVVVELDDHAAPSRHPSERHPIDQKTALGLLEEVVTESKEPEVIRRVVEGLSEGKPQTEIASELGLPDREIRDLVAQLRRHFRRKVYSAVGPGALSVGLIVVAVRALHPDDGRVYRGVPDGGPSAAELRKRAQPFCERAEWDECVRLLDSAAGLDPQGEASPEVQKIRQAAREQRRDK